MIEILYFASVILSEVKNVRNVLAAKMHRSPSASSGQAFASLRMTKFTGVKNSTGGGQLRRLPF